MSARLPEDGSGPDPSTPLLKQHRYGNGGRQREFPYLRARIVSVLVPMLLGSAMVSRESLLAQYLVDRLGQDQNKSHRHVNPCLAGKNSSDVKDANDLEAQTAVLTSHLALTQTIPAFFACLMFGSYSDFLGRRKMLLIPMFTSLVKTLMTSLIIGLHLPLWYMYLCYAIDGLSGSWFTLLIALYALTADINRNSKWRTLSIFAIQVLTAVAQAGVGVATGDLISSLGFLDASLLITSLAAAGFVLPLFLLPETLHCQQYEVDSEEVAEAEADGQAHIQESESEAKVKPQQKAELEVKDWINPVQHIGRMFAFYTTEGSVRRRVEMVICLLIFMFPVGNEINQGALDALYQLHRPFCWGPKRIGAYNAIRSGSSSSLGTVWLILLQKCLPFEVVGMLGVFFQAVAFGFEAFIQSTWQFYLVPALLIPSIPTAAIMRGIMSMKAKAGEQGALFSSIAVVECLVTLVTTTAYNRLYSVTLDTAFPGAVYFLMAGCAFLAFLLYIVYFIVRERPARSTVAEVEIVEPAQESTPS